MNERDHEWLEPVRKELLESVETIDAATRSRLIQVRQRALAHIQPRRFPGYLPPLAALAAASVVFAVALVLRQPAAPQQDMLDDLDLISASASLELLEDLDFYEWLEAYDLPG